MDLGRLRTAAVVEASLGSVKAMRTRPFEIVEGEMEYERTDGYSMNNQEGFSMMNQEKDWDD